MIAQLPGVNDAISSPVIGEHIFNILISFLGLTLHCYPMYEQMDQGHSTWGVWLSSDSFPEGKEGTFVSVFVLLS